MKIWVWDTQQHNTQTLQLKIFFHTKNKYSSNGTSADSFEIDRSVRRLTAYQTSYSSARDDFPHNDSIFFGRGITLMQLMRMPTGFGKAHVYMPLLNYFRDKMMRSATACITKQGEIFVSSDINPKKQVGIFSIRVEMAGREQQQHGSITSARTITFTTRNAHPFQKQHILEATDVNKNMPHETRKSSWKIYYNVSSFRVHVEVSSTCRTLIFSLRLE